MGLPDWLQCCRFLPAHIKLTKTHDPREPNRQATYRSKQGGDLSRDMTSKTNMELREIAQLPFLCSEKVLLLLR